jgi:hypothetical protein
MDGNPMKRISAGGDFLETWKSNQNTYVVGHQLTMFLNVNDLPHVRPAVKKFFLWVRFSNQYVDEPTLPNEKAKDDGLKICVVEPSFADGMMWLVLDEYKSFLAFGKTFKPIPEVVVETAAANKAEGEDIIEALGHGEDKEQLIDTTKSFLVKTQAQTLEKYGWTMTQVNRIRALNPTFHLVLEDIIGVKLAKPYEGKTALSSLNYAIVLVRPIPVPPPMPNYS